MISWTLLGEHLAGLALLWTWVLLAGLAWSPVLRLRIGLVGVPLLGVVYWTVALYLFRFRGGLDVAAGLVLVLAAWAAWRAWRARVWLTWRRPSWGTLLMFLGSAPYASTLFMHYVPMGMDSTMHTTNAVLIARSGGLPDDYAPFLPELPFPAVNLGLPAVAGVAIRWGGDPSAVMLSCHHLTFTSLLLATYLLLRWWTGRTSAAVLAVVSVWMARASQNTIAWGGFPTVMSAAIGVFAARLLIQQARIVHWRGCLAAGCAVAAIPLTHGVGGGTWVYCVGGWICLACLLSAREWRRTLWSLALSGAAAGVVLGIYYSSGALELKPHEAAQIRYYAQQHAPPRGDWPDWVMSIRYVSQNSENVLVWAGWAACAVLGLRGRWAASLLLAAAWATLILVVTNSHWYVLPASFLLYPERVLYWTAPLCAVGLALALRCLPSRIQSNRRWLAAASIASLALAGYYHNKLYQKLARAEFLNRDSWEALVWARQHLSSDRDFVSTPYNSTGSYLPALAQVGCSGGHYHLFYTDVRVKAHERRTVTHVLVDQKRTPREVPPGEVVFRNSTIVIVKNGQATPAPVRLQ